MNKVALLTLGDFAITDALILNLPLLQLSFVFVQWDILEKCVKKNQLSISLSFWVQYISIKLNYSLSTIVNPETIKQPTYLRCKYGTHEKSVYITVKFTVIPLYFLHLITAPNARNKCKLEIPWFIVSSTLLHHCLS